MKNIIIIINPHLNKVLEILTAPVFSKRLTIDVQHAAMQEINMTSIS